MCGEDKNEEPQSNKARTDFEAVQIKINRPIVNNIPNPVNLKYENVQFDAFLLKLFAFFIKLIQFKE
ncbi:MAG: hypothetical protein M5E90_07600 [Asgard group archaeon]|nr:hypothetical protein [Asgard group archaeon]